MCVSLWCLACLDELRAIILCKTDVDIPLTVNFHIYVGNVRVQLPKGPDRGPQEGPKANKTLPWQCQSSEVSSHCLDSVNQMCPSMQASRTAMRTN